MYKHIFYNIMPYNNDIYSLQNDNKILALLRYTYTYKYIIVGTRAWEQFSQNKSQKVSNRKIFILYIHVN